MWASLHVNYIISPWFAGVTELLDHFSFCVGGRLHCRVSCKYCPWISSWLLQGLKETFLWKNSVWPHWWRCHGGPCRYHNLAFKDPCKVSMYSYCVTTCLTLLQRFMGVSVWLFIATHGDEDCGDLFYTKDYSSTVDTVRHHLTIISI